MEPAKKFSIILHLDFFRVHIFNVISAVVPQGLLIVQSGVQNKNNRKKKKKK